MAKLFHLRLNATGKQPKAQRPSISEPFGFEHLQTRGKGGMTAAAYRRLGYTTVACALAQETVARAQLATMRPAAAPTPAHDREAPPEGGGEPIYDNVGGTGGGGSRDSGYPPPPKQVAIPGGQCRAKTVTLFRGQVLGFGFGLGEDRDTRVIVSRVIPGMPAAGKLFAGDIITAVNGTYIGRGGFDTATEAVISSALTLQIQVVRRHPEEHAAEAGTDTAEPTYDNAEYMAAPRLPPVLALAKKHRSFGVPKTPTLQRLRQGRPKGPARRAPTNHARKAAHVAGKSQ